MKKTNMRTVIPPPTASHVVEFSVAASFLYLADIMERFCDLLSNSVKNGCPIMYESIALRLRTNSLRPDKG